MLFLIRGMPEQTVCGHYAVLLVNKREGTIIIIPENDGGDGTAFFLLENITNTISYSFQIWKYKDSEIWLSLLKNSAII